MVSWAPASEKQVSLAPDKIKMNQRNGEAIRGLTIRRTFYDPAFDAFKRKWFFRPVRLHFGDLDARWDETEAKTRRLLETYTAKLTPSVFPKLVGWWLRLSIAVLPSRDFYVAAALWAAIRVYRPVINRDIRLAYVYANRDEYILRLKRRIIGGS
jgi:hypothetical protein